jgi:Ser/Thr protein kinase RdoA (MazF antagonist)
MRNELVTYVREAFGWDGDVTIEAGPRGALGQIWRIETGPHRYALKEIFFEPPTPERIATELDFARRATAAGVRLPASHPDREGRYLVTAPDGTWLRLYEWVDMVPVAPADPAMLGALLARLHRCAPATTEPPATWYDRVPVLDAWADARFAGIRAIVPELYAMVEPTDLAQLIVCHRDLHPENVHSDHNGGLVVVDWDNVGPAMPSRELAHLLFDWFADDLDAMAQLYRAYTAEGGPGRITGPADFTMLIATRLNFVSLQAHIAADPRSAPRDREWAEREVEEMLPLVPTPRQLADVLSLVGGR